MDHAAYVDAAAAALGLKIAADWKPAVVQYMALAEAFATQVDGLPLTPADEGANIFRPVEPDRGE